MSAAEGASEASSPEQANELAMRANRRASGPVLASLFLFVPDHSGPFESDQLRMESKNSLVGGLEEV